jgi:acyl-CoA synthetase (AMP-forming)/AMP-acid ligase II
MLNKLDATGCDGSQSCQPTISEIIPHWAGRHPDRVAVTEGALAYTFGELDRSVRDTAEMLRRTGIEPGDRVMIVCENCCAAVVTYFSVIAIGAWPVIVNARLADREIDEVRDHCEPRRIIYTIGASLRARAHSKRHGGVAIDSVALGEISLGPLNEDAHPEPLDPRPESRVAALIYTTGTTGRPKGVMLTHRNLLFVARESARIRGLGPDDRIYAVLPVSHILGLTGVLISSLLSGAQIHLTSRFDPAVALSAISEDGISVMIGTPPMYAMLAEYTARNNLVPVKAPSLRLISAAGAPLDAATKAVAEKTFGQTLHNGYGITETSPTLTLTRLDAPRADCSVGQMMPGIEVRLENPNGEPPAVGEPGELFVRGAGVMKGYYKSPDETAQVVDSEGWFKTGDLARVDNGNFFIVGRSKELIIRFGFNVYPVEIESVLNAHPHVARSAVVGRKAEGGEEVLAFVQLKQGFTATTAELAGFAAQQLTSYKRPSKIFMVESMPASATGKIIKSALTAMAQG